MFVPSFAPDAFRVSLDLELLALLLSLFPPAPLDDAPFDLDPVEVPDADGGVSGLAALFPRLRGALDLLLPPRSPPFPDPEFPFPELLELLLLLLLLWWWLTLLLLLLALFVLLPLFPWPTL